MRNLLPELFSFNLYKFSDEVRLLDQLGLEQFKVKDDPFLHSVTYRIPETAMKKLMVHLRSSRLKWKQEFLRGIEERLGGEEEDE